jgi:hypothetical protein
MRPCVCAVKPGACGSTARDPRDPQHTTQLSGTIFALHKKRSRNLTPQSDAVGTKEELCQPTHISVALGPYLYRGDEHQ